ncbi:MAG: hypothetical protein ABI672_11330 [Vicinamibacteria bacterium]
MRSTWPGRTAVTLVAAATTILVIGWARTPNPLASMPEGEFWERKFTAPQSDIVFAGDSRVGIGISPAAVEATAGLSCLNYAFTSVGYSGEYVAAIRDHVRPSGVIVLGISPWTLTPRSLLDNGFKGLSALPRRSPRLARAALDWRLRFQSTMKALNTAVMDEAHFGTTLHLDGWMEVHAESSDPKKALSLYAQNFDDNPVSDELVSRVMGSVRDWSRQDILVLGFRPPATLDMVSLENRKGAFDEAAFVRRFKDAGGVWLDIPLEYDTYDGSHLLAASAQRLSHEIGRAIRGRQRR